MEDTRNRSLVGESTRLISGRSVVRVHPIPPSPRRPVAQDLSVPKNSKEYDNRYKKSLYAAKMAEWKQLLGGICTKCQTEDDLEFDHINPEEKSFSISDGWSRASEEVLKELKKCQLLCERCHKIKSDEYQRRNRKHGTWGSYRNGKCRCEICKEFVRSYQREHRKRQGPAV